MEKSKTQKFAIGKNGGTADYSFTVQDWENMFDAFEQSGMILDHEHNILFVNAATERLTGKRRQELIGKKCYEIFHGTGAPVTGCPMESVLLQECQRSDSKEMALMGGHFIVTCSKACVEGDEHPKIIHISPDISHLKKHEKMIEEQAKFQAVLSQVSSKFSGIAPEHTDEAIEECLDILGGYTGADRSYVFIFKDEKSFLVTNTHEWCSRGVPHLLDEFRQTDFATNYPWFTSLLKMRKTINIPATKQIPAEGKKEQSRLKSAGIRSLLIVPMIGRKKLYGFVGIESTTVEREWPKDFTLLLKVIGENIVQAIELEKSFAELSRDRNILQTLMDNIPDTLYLKDDKSRFTQVNKAQAKVLGLKDPKEATGKTDADFFSDEFAKKTQKEERSLLSSKQPIIDLTEKVSRPDGSFFWGSATKVPIYDSKGRSVGLIGITRNISHRVQRQQKKEAINELCLYLLGDYPMEQKIHKATETVVEVFDACFSRVWLTKEGDLCDNGCRFGKDRPGSDCEQHQPCLHLVSSSGHYKRINGSHRRLPLGRAMVGKFAVSTEHSCLSNDIQSEELITDKEWAKKLGLKSFAAHKIGADMKNPYGVLALFSRHTLDREDELLLSILANTLSQAIQLHLSQQAIKQSEYKYRRLFEEMTAGFALIDIVWDKNGNPIDYRFLEINPAFEKMLALKAEEVVGRTLLELLPELDSSWIDTFNQVALSGKSLRMENYLKEFNVWLDVVLYSPEPGKLAAVFEDVTSKRRDRELLQQSEARFKALFDEAPIGYHEIDQNGTITNVNLTEAGMLGYSKEEMIGRPVWEFVASPHAQTRVLNKLNDFKIRSQGFETLYRKKNGRTLPVFVHDRLIKNENGKVIGIYSTIQDYTARKKMEKRMAESELRFRSLIESATDAIILANQLGKIVLWNNAASTIFGYQRDEIIGQSIDKLLLEEVAQRHTSFLSRIRLGGQPRLAGKTVKVVGRRKNGQEFAAELSFSIWKVLGKKYFTAIIRDVSERQTLERQLQQAQKMEAVGTLAGGIAHDFNNILGAIMGYAELSLEDLPETSITHQNLKKVLTASNRAKELVKQILIYSRMEEDDIHPVKIQQSVVESLGLLRATIPSSIKLNTILEANDAVIMADAGQIHQILMNLCGNAVHAIGEDAGTITISLKEVVLQPGSNGHPSLLKGKHVELKVADTGCGMTENIIERIFDPFFTTKEVGKGTGLGLSVIKGLVDKIKGHLSVTSQVGKGSAFTILLPIMENSPIKKSIENKDIPGGNESILYVDDEEALVEIAKARFESLGYTVTGTTDSKEALELFKSASDRFDLVITDQAMPKMSGKKLSEAILKIRPDIPIILCTGYSESINETEALQMGIRRFLYKPVNNKLLTQIVREIFDKKESKSKQLVEDRVASGPLEVA